MCAAHEAVQIATVAEFTLFDKAKYPNVDGVTAIPHNKGCGCSDGSNIEVMLRTLAAYAEHPNVAGVVFIGLGCEKTNLTVMEKYLNDQHRPLNKPVARIGIQDAGGTQGAVKRGLEAVEAMLPVANQITRTPAPISELSLGVKCGGSDGFSGLSANPALGRAADELVRQGGTVLITEVPEFCGAEHILAWRAKDAATGHAVYDMVDWYKDYASKFGTVLNENPSPGNVAGGLLNITIKSLGAIAKAGTTRVEGVVGYAEQPKGRGLYLMQGPGYDQESTPGLIASGAQLVVFTTGPRHHDRQRHRAGAEAGVQQPDLRAHEVGPGHVGRRHHRRYPLDRRSRPRGLRARPARRQRRDARQVGGEQAPRVPGVGRAERQPLGRVRMRRRNAERRTPNADIIASASTFVLRRSSFCVQRSSRVPVKAAVLSAPGVMSIREIADPVVGPRDVVVRVTGVGLCGTDFHIYEGHANYHTDRLGQPIPFDVSPQVLGHEVAGVVEAAGSEVRDLSAGDAVVLDQGRNCLSAGDAPRCASTARRATRTSARRMPSTASPAGRAGWRRCS